MDYRTFEQRVLDVLFQTRDPLTSAYLAYSTRIPVAEAEKHLEQMVRNLILVKECNEDTGAVTYVYPQRALVPLHTGNTPALMPLRRPLYSPVVAAALTILLPGAGHMYSGRARAGVFWMMGTLAGYLCLVIPGIILHVMCIASAANVPRS